MKLAVIVAAAENGVIGRDNALPWHIPADLRYFKRMTLGKPIIMGRKTWDSIGRPLPGRTSIVVSRNPAIHAPGARVAATLDEALTMGREVAARDGVPELVVIGGAEIYRLALPLADRIYLTEVHSNCPGDAHLPAIDWSGWHEVSRERHPAESDKVPAFSFVVFEKNTP